MTVFPNLILLQGDCLKKNSYWPYFQHGMLVKTYIIVLPTSPTQTGEGMQNSEKPKIRKVDIVSDKQSKNNTFGEGSFSPVIMSTRG